MSTSHNGLGYSMTLSKLSSLRHDILHTFNNSCSQSMLDIHQGKSLDGLSLFFVLLSPQCNKTLFLTLTSCFISSESHVMLLM